MIMAPGGKDDGQQSDKYMYTWADDPDSDSDSEFTGLEGTTPKQLEKLQRKKRELIDKFSIDVGRVSAGKTPLNIAIIGTPGCGKSSAINTFCTAFSEDQYHSYAQTGMYTDELSGYQVTYQTKSFPKEKYCPQRKNTCLPTFIDIAGFEDVDTDVVEELLRIVFYGRLPEGEGLNDAQEYFKQRGILGIQEKYSKNENHLKVDRIIFVAAATQSIPVNLIKRVVAASNPTGGAAARGKKTIPVFGVLTKVDLVDFESDKDAKEREEKLIGLLGLKGAEHKYSRIVNYCNDIDKEKKRMETVFPELDVPALRFLRQVCDPVYEVSFPEENFEDAIPKQKEPEPVTVQEVSKKQEPDRPLQPFLGLETMSVFVVSLLLIGMIVAVYVQIFLSPALSHDKLIAACAELTSLDKVKFSNSNSNCKIEVKDELAIFSHICDNKKDFMNPNFTFHTLVLVCLVSCAYPGVSMIIQVFMKNYLAHKK